MSSEYEILSDWNMPQPSEDGSFGAATPAQEEVKKFLTTLGLAEFWGDFRFAGVDEMDVLQQLSDNQFERLRLGVGHIVKLRNAIRKLQASNTNGHGDDAAVEASETGGLPEVDPDVYALLLDVGLQQHSTLFAQHGLVRLEDVLDLKEHHMEKIGLVVGHSLRLSRAISQRLREREEAASSTQPETPFSEQEANWRLYEALPEAQKNRNDEALLTACKNGYLQRVEQLLTEAGANPNATAPNDDNGFTPLHWAALYGHLEVVRFLAGKGALVNARNRRGLAPLHVAVDFDRCTVIEFLVGQASADPNLPDRKGKSPMRYAEGKPRIAKVLRDAGGL
mmetsp:Transcript_59475/g.125993  ORF Transcript_59475/g.125993 Transcript_59475/m.125993 type:complete len:337 (-) Transcript_59475:201-1211(-)